MRIESRVLHPESIGAHRCVMIHPSKILPPGPYHNTSQAPDIHIQHIQTLPSMHNNVFISIRWRRARRIPLLCLRPSLRPRTAKGDWRKLDCSAVKSITYTKLRLRGTYNEITSMNGGALLVSWHFRGPLILKQFAFYSPGSGSGSGAGTKYSAPVKREVKPSIHKRRHGHQHKRRGDQYVTATIDGQVVSWLYKDQVGANAAPTQAPGAPAAGVSYKTTPPKKSSPVVNPGSGKWGRQGYYNADSGVTDGLTFLNHNGGQGSGVFDYELGNSLSYASEDGCSGSDSPKVLKTKMIPDNKEVIIMTDKVCNGDCGTVREGTVAYHGFDGDYKIFLVEFSMPLTGKTGWNEDMPAAWILNAAIPRTLQYGKADCSCWKSGCAFSGGDSNYFTRPTQAPIKLAVVFNNEGRSVHIKILEDSFEFKPTLDGKDVASILEEAESASTFALS
ncbi:uncharacterized protein PADG_02424 [Paracoccidioides brasiliensis Pb18]|uniref:Cell wall protein YJL171C/Tos1 C-terminal domain-containing protein n=1 Tax=Paracoccidioides brasiliensis (strain Pb18) TaxID=502780 RepID=C1G5G9_PARBD|nr:uncharacterized protein PADG_02424 [Paracoccidioides brasiliensis Pb18]EEH46326.2 hypothetical protein PADG_02424 [Paracoccidioides brasiliensis Pb18]